MSLHKFVGEFCCSFRIIEKYNVLIKGENIPLAHSWKGQLCKILGRACCWDGQGSTYLS